MAVLVLLCRIALGGFFAVLGLDLVAGVLPPEQLPAPVLAVRDALADPAVTAPAWRGVVELLAGVMVLGGVWLPLGLLLLAPVLVHVGLHQCLAVGSPGPRDRHPDDPTQQLFGVEMILQVLRKNLAQVGPHHRDNHVSIPPRIRGDIRLHGAADSLVALLNPSW